MAIVESVVEILLQKLADPLIREAILLHGVGDQVQWLEDEFGRMKRFLKDADAKQEGDERVKGWVGDVRDVAYDAEDVIDTFVFKVANLRRTGFVGCIKRYACIFNELLARHQVGWKIERIKGKISEISESRLTYGIENIGEGAGTSSAGLSLQERRLTSPNVEEPDFVGFDNDLKALVTQLTNEGELRRCVVSVVGMGGLGKTTLTRKVYNTDSVKKHFHTHAWISISQQPSVKDILQVLVRHWMVVSDNTAEKLHIAELRDKISGYLIDKRYLVVLDDIWKREAWDALKDAFPDVKNGSRVMLTTRIKDLASYADQQREPHELRFLTNEESWDLLCKKTFVGQDGGCPQDLEKLGREIVEKCHGLPLAIAVVGGLLSGKKLFNEWENVCKSISWQLGQSEVQISSILSLSYKDLPYDLKPCFLYLAKFPEDYEFKAKELIQLWAAEGFLKERGELTLEEVGEDNLMQLVQRSMVQVARRSSSKGIKSCRIHDLLRDLSISEAKESKFLEVQFLKVQDDNGNATPAASRARRLAIYIISRGELHPTTHAFKRRHMASTPHLRSMSIIYNRRSRWLGTWLGKEESKFLFQGFKLLRVLYLNRVVITELPKQIGELIHLRYLQFTKTVIKTLPSSIGNLINLQTLFVRSNTNFGVPETIGKMHQLRHLQLGEYKQASGLRPMLPYWGVIRGHPRLDLISNLQTLSGVWAGKWMEGCLGKLTNLRNLKISIKTGADAELFCKAIVNLNCLHRLLLVWKLVPTRGTEDRELPLSLPNLSHLLKLSKLYLRGELETLPEFPTYLTKLTLGSSRLKEDPMATLEKLKSLRILKLRHGSYVGKNMACSAEGFPRLESLYLEHLDELEEWRVEEGAMPSLLHLQIHDGKQLKKLPEGLQHVTTLKKLELWSMPYKFKPRVEEDRGEDWYKIRHIPSIDIHDSYRIGS